MHVGWIYDNQMFLNTLAKVLDAVTRKARRVKEMPYRRYWHFKRRPFVRVKKTSISLLLSFASFFTLLAFQARRSTLTQQKRVEQTSSDEEPLFESSLSPLLWFGSSTLLAFQTHCSTLPTQCRTIVRRKFVYSVDSTPWTVYISFIVPTIVSLFFSLTFADRRHALPVFHNLSQ